MWWSSVFSAIQRSRNRRTSFPQFDDQGTEECLFCHSFLCSVIFKWQKRRIPSRREDNHLEDQRTEDLMIILSQLGIFPPFVFFERDLSFSTAAEWSKAAVIHFFDRNNFLLKPLTFNIQNTKNLFLFFSSTVDQVVHGYVLVFIGYTNIFYKNKNRRTLSLNFP